MLESSWLEIKKAGLALDAFVRRQPMHAAVILGALYLVVFQRQFVLTGDVWAETHMEYLDEALKHGPEMIFTPGWAGYLSLLPSLLAELYVSLGLPIGYIDVFYKLAIVVFALGCMAACASNTMKGLVENVWLRLALALSMLLLLKDISIFSFINIWYLGFVPLILLCLSTSKLTEKQQLFFAVGGLLLVLTKPSILLLPFVLYRMVRTKEYFSGGVVAAGVVLQTVTMIFFDPRNAGAAATREIVTIVKAVFTGGGVELLKMLHVIPTHFVYVVLANALLLGILVIIYRRWGLVRAGLLVFGYAFAVYAYVLAPDAAIFSRLTNYEQIYAYNFKYQREFLVNIFLVISMFLAAMVAWPLIRKRLPGRVGLVVAGVTAGLWLGLLHTPIDVESAGVAASISPFRQSLNTGQSVCVPIPPTPKYFPNANWQYAFNTECHNRNFDRSPDYDSMNISLRDKISFTILNDASFDEDRPLKTVYVVVKNLDPKTPAAFKLTEVVSGKEFTGYVPARGREELNFIPVNVASVPMRDEYEFTISSDSDQLRWGRFDTGDVYLYYPYFGETRAPYRWK